MPDVRTVRLPGGEEVPALGQGTWFLGDDGGVRDDEIRALRRGLDLGLTLIDTAEMYGDGRSEDLVGEAIAGRRDEVFLVSKVLPENASADGTVRALEGSLERLGTDYLDLYLLHWRGGIDLAESVEALQGLADAGKIRYWGVSNFDVDDLDELADLPQGGAFQTDQVLYNLTRRGIEFDLLPRLSEHRVPVMAYSPIEQGRLLGHPVLAEVALRHEATAGQVALAWVLRHRNVIAIPKASRVAHVEQNHAGLTLTLDEADVAELDAAFPAPRSAQPLEML